MTPEFTNLLVILCLIFLMIIRIPVAIAMIISGMLGYIALEGISPLLSQFNQKLYFLFSSYSLSVIPLFILMGQLATNSKLSHAIFASAHKLLGNYRGGFAMSSIGACGIFGAICGSSLATVATMGKIIKPQMKNYNYPQQLTTGAVAAGGTLSVLIPPSLAIIIYSVITEQNIIKMFISAIIPSILTIICYLLAIICYVRLKPNISLPKPQTISKDKQNSESFGLIMSLGIFCLVIGGIYIGIFTPNEAAAVGVCACALVALKNKMPKKLWLDCFAGTATTTGMIYLILLGAEVLNSFLGLSQMPQFIASWVANEGFQPYTVLLIFLAILIVLGCFMDSLSIILITIPIFFPVMISLDFGLNIEQTGIWFGIITLVIIEIGLITPPMGLNVYVIHQIFGKKIPMSQTFKGVAPFLIADFIRLILLICFPIISIGLLKLLY